MTICNDSWVKAFRNSEILPSQSHHIPHEIPTKGGDHFIIDWVRTLFTVFWKTM